MKARVLVALLGLGLFTFGCEALRVKRTATPAPTVKFLVLDPGHFHAALVQKTMYPQVDPTVHVYAPPGPDVEDYLNRIAGFNSRPDNPTAWRVRSYTGPGFLQRMLDEHAGNVVVLSGRNIRKPNTILASVDAGLNVLADKPLVIRPDDFGTLVKAFRHAQQRNLLVLDIMTERYEITTLLQRELARIPDVFGTLQTGSYREPAITKESVHHVYKQVAGRPIKRPPWFFDETERGEALVDVSTHLVDLIQWECFPEQILDFTQDVHLMTARRWTTDLTLDQFRRVTGLARYPRSLRKNVHGSALRVYSGGEMIYRLKGITAKVSVTWNFQAPAGTGDTHHSVMRGTLSRLVIRQGPEEDYVPTLYIEAEPGHEIESAVMRAVRQTLQGKYPGIALDYLSPTRWRVTIPERYRVGHEAHFAQVTQKYLEYLAEGTCPDWEVPNMLAKYYTTTEALKLAMRP